MLSTFPLFLFLYSSLHLRHLPSFPTRRSSDLASASPRSGPAARTDPRSAPSATCRCSWNAGSSIFPARPRDRKSTRLNSSHQIISYAVFCLKKKKKKKINNHVQSTDREHDIR